MAGPGASIDLIASTVVAGFHGSAPDYNGRPLLAVGGTINLSETAVYGGAFDLPEGDLPGLAYYATQGGAFTADGDSWVSPVDDQSAQDVRDLFQNKDLLTEDPGLSRDFLPYPQSITPLLGDAAMPGVLIDVIDGGLSFGGTEITLDVLGNDRVDGNGKRDIGAVQLNLAPHLAVALTGDMVVGLNWTRPLDSIPPLTGYEICYGTGADPDLSGADECPGTMIDIPGADTLTATVDNLANGTPYWFYVRGVNSPWSNGVTATPLGPIDTPDVTATPRDREVKVSWTEPAAGGHPGPLLYSVVYRPVGTDAWVAGPSFLSALTTTIPELKNGTEYRFGVYATATDGAKSELGSATATPHGDIGTVNRSPDQTLAANNKANKPKYWENLGYGKCMKQEVEDGFGSVWDLGADATALILKSGRVNDVWIDPMAGLYGTASAKDISHAIVCVDQP